MKNKIEINNNKIDDWYIKKKTENSKKLKKN